MDTFQEEVKAEMEATVLSKSNTQKKYYRVQLGAFSVKAAGFNDAFIKYSE